MIRSFSKAAILVICSGAIALILAELGLRRTPYLYLTHPRSFPTGYFLADAVLGADHAVNFPPRQLMFRGPTHDVFTNRFGCFDRNDPVEEGYVLVLGDSFAWGWTSLDHHWATRLEELSGRRIVKCGVSGTGTKEQLLKGRKVVDALGVKPAIILVLYTDNDFNDDVVFPGYTVIEGQRVNTLKELDLRSGKLIRYTEAELRQAYLDAARGPDVTARLSSALVSFALFKFVRQSYARSLSRDVSTVRHRYQVNLLDLDVNEHPWLEEALLGHLGNIWEFRKMADDYGARLALFLTKASSDTPLRERIYAAIRSRVSYQYDVGEFVESHADGRRTAYQFDGHWNELGNALAAEGMHRFGAKAGLL